MYLGDENIILFPKWKTALREESLQDLQANRYIDALEKLNELIHYNVRDHEIIIGKMMCLMELGRYQEAEDVCEEIIQNKNDEHYFHYVHMYLTILFQSNKYDILLERIEEELSSENLPFELREQFLQLYDISEKMESDAVERKTSVYINELLDAVDDSDHKKQWRKIMNLKDLGIEPDSFVILLLEREDVHPVIKTAIFLWLQEHNYSKAVKVQKFGNNLQIMPVDIPQIKELNLYKEIMHHLQILEQENPIMHMFLEEGLYRYLYVHYPILPPNGDKELIADALIKLSDYLLNQDASALDDAQVKYYLDELIKGEHLYLSIIED